MLCFGGAIARVDGEEDEPVCFLGDGEARKKKKVGHFRSWKKLLEWLWVALDQVLASRFKWAGLGLKPKHGNRAGYKAFVTKFSAGLGSSLVATDLYFLGLLTGLELVSAHAQREALLVTSISGDSGFRFSSPQ